MRYIELAVSVALVLSVSACSSNSSSNPPTTITEVPVTNPELPVNDPDGPVTTPEVPDPDMAVFPPVYVTPDGVEQCSVDDIKRRVDFDMRDYYIYYDQVPSLNLNDYEDASLLIEDLRVAPDTFSSVGDFGTQSALFNEGETAGHGFWFQPAGDGVVRFRYIRYGSPADDAGLIRGDELLSLNGIDLSEVTNDNIRTALDPDNSPVVMSVRTGEEDPRTVSVAYETYRWTTAGPANGFLPTDPNSGLPRVGYLPVRSFLATTKDELDSAFRVFRAEGGIDELIVDLRYNGGGRTSVARYLASVVGGAVVANQVAYTNAWNDKYSRFNDTEYFDEVEQPLDLARVFVLTSDRTASSSEIFINSLEPYIDVVLIGETTFGKPFTSNTRNYCEKAITAMRSVRLNAVGVSVAGGMAADCAAQDDWQVPSESSRDPMVSATLRFLTDGSCDAPGTMIADMQRSSFGPTGPSFEPEDASRFVSED